MQDVGRTSSVPLRIDFAPKRKRPLRQRKPPVVHSPAYAAFFLPIFPCAQRFFSSNERRFRPAALMPRFLGAVVVTRPLRDAVVPVTDSSATMAFSSRSRSLRSSDRIFVISIERNLKGRG